MSGETATRYYPVAETLISRSIEIGEEKGVDPEASIDAHRMMTEIEKTGYSDFLRLQAEFSTNAPSEDVVALLIDNICIRESVIKETRSRYEKQGVYLLPQVDYEILAALEVVQEANQANTKIG